EGLHHRRRIQVDHHLLAVRRHAGEGRGAAEFRPWRLRQGLRPEHRLWRRRDPRGDRRGGRRQGRHEGAEADLRRPAQGQHRQGGHPGRDRASTLRRVAGTDQLPRRRRRRLYHLEPAFRRPESSSPPAAGRSFQAELAVTATSETNIGAGAAAGSGEWLARFARSTETIVIPLIAILVAATIFSVFLLVLGKSPIEFFSLLWFGGFGTSFSWTNTLVRAGPLIFTALCVAIPARLGMVIIG